MKKLLFILLYAIPALPSYSQLTFSKSIDVDFDADSGVAIRAVQDGYLLLAGSICFSNTLDCYSILKTDFEGNIIWKKQLNNFPYKIKPTGNYNNHGIAVNETQDVIYFSGIIQPQGNPFDIFLIKTDEQGDSLWLKTYGGAYIDLSASVFYRTDTTLLLFGDFAVGTGNDDVIWLLETDLDGNVVWEETYGEEYGMVGRQDIIQLANKDIVFTYLSCDQSGFCTTGDEQVLKITKIDSIGVEIWTKDVYYFDELWSNSSLVGLDDGGFLLSFYRQNFQQGWFYPPILIWLDSMGNVINQYNFPADSESTIQDLAITTSGNIIGVGYIDKFDLGLVGWVFAMSQEGELLWNREIADLRFPAKISQLNAVEEAENGGLIMTGSIMDTFLNHIPAFNNQNVWLLKLDSMGCLEPGCVELQILTEAKEIVVHDDLFTIFPNPSKNELIVRLNKTSKIHSNLKAVIYNSIGEKVLLTPINDNNISVIDVSDLPSGLYFVQILNEFWSPLQIENFLIVE